MDLYEENIPTLLHSTDAYIRIKNMFFDLLVKNTKRLTDSTDNMIEVIKTDDAFNLYRPLSSPTQVLERYDQCIQLMEKIIGRIDTEYNRHALRILIFKTALMIKRKMNQIRQIIPGLILIVFMPTMQKLGQTQLNRSCIIRFWH